MKIINHRYFTLIVSLLSAFYFISLVNYGFQGKAGIFINAIAELLTIPMLLITVFIIFLSISNWIRKDFWALKSIHLLSFFIAAATMAVLFFEE